MKDKILRKTIFGRDTEINDCSNARTQSIIIPTDDNGLDKKITFRNDDGLFGYFLNTIEKLEKRISENEKEISEFKSQLDKKVDKPIINKRGKVTIDNCDFTIKDFDADKPFFEVTKN